MLRTLVLLLLLANLAFFAWTQGWVDDIAGVRASGQREPERLAQQVRPEAVRILPASGARGVSPPNSAPIAAPRPTTAASDDAAPAPVAAAASTQVAEAVPAALPAAPVCLEAGPFSGAEATAAESVLKSALPEGGWVSVKTGRPGLWMVYLGKFKDRDELLKRHEELRAKRIEYDDLRSPPELVPGLSLGRFEARSNAANALEKFALQGVRGARVIEVRSPANNVLLRFEQADRAVADKLAALDTPALGKGFVPCARPAGN